ncbi:MULTISPECIES: acyl carrier protein [Streptomyces]|uniref:acyl carrier protein n=1 Tax=Streptomyces TaxID=1883 RepID=UPI00081D4663|nr:MULTISPECIES: acyl carrier protein [Streptomyces]OSC76777.1 polyketide-8 synthase acyl carrier protein [Streptomyces sp. BF-3]KAA6204247.1 acyl carrier protein [Streptomyces parvus]PVC82629.1 acyl carrier protein [Streptomyces sp. CS131]UCA53955.1 acyl carrier protein [Streptomyces sp. WA6-1-16]SCF83724.1 acyl carrier protein [Streptomyces sp. Cmuel-A718b]
MPTITDERRATIREIICDILELEDDEVTDTSLFIDDHGADSLRAIEILASLEKEFGITIEQSELSEMVNLERVYKVVAEAPGR